MGGLIIFGIVIGALVVFDILALRNGEDSRPELGASPTPNGFRIV
jgi:hypothetical protein